MYNQALELNAEIKFEKVIEVTSDLKVTTNKDSYQAKAIILATGSDHRKLGISNESELIGKGVSYCATCDGNFYRGKDVAVVGGGNSALEEALYLSNLCNQVYLIHRRDTFRGDQKSIDEINKKANIKPILNTNVVKINGTDKKFNAGTYYGEIIQAQLDADKCPIKAYDSTKGSGDGYDGWYNTTNAKAYLDKAIEDLKKLDIEVTKDKPIVLDFPTFTGSAIYANRGNAVKKSIEDTFGGLVLVNIVDCPTSDDWYNVGYYTETGKEANYDMYDCSGWGPDYGDPSTYLDTFLPDGAGYMVKCIGLF